MKIFVTLLFVIFNWTVLAQSKKSIGILIDFGHHFVISDNSLGSTTANSLHLIARKSVDGQSVGLGFGLDGYRDFDYNTAPFFIDLRTGTDKIEYFVEFGYALKLGLEFEEGLMFSGGINYGLIQNWLRLSLAYNSQKIVNIGNSSFDTTNNSLKIGIVLNPFQ